MALPYPPPETRSQSFSASLNLTEKILEQVKAQYNAEYVEYMEGKRPKPAPPESLHRFQAIIDERFSEELKRFIEVRLNGELGDSLDNVALRIVFTSLASELIQALPAFSLYIKSKVAEADKVKLPPVAKDEVDLVVEQALSDRLNLKLLLIRLEKGEVTPDDHIRKEDIERAKQYLRRRVSKAHG